MSYLYRRYRGELVTYDDTDGMVSSALQGLRQHGVGGMHVVPLSQWYLKHGGTNWKASEVAISYPMLLRGLHREDLEVFKGRGEWWIQGPLHTPGMHVHRAREMAGWYLDRNFTCDDPHQVLIPKITFDDLSIDPVTLVRLLASPNPSGTVVGERKLTIQPLETKVLASSLQAMLLPYLSRWWRNCVVGFRPGVGAHQILAALKNAIETTGRVHVLAADVSNFFDKVPLDKALNQLHNLTKYRDDPVLRRLFAIATEHKGLGLPQGNPLSPLLANIYGHYAIDKEAVRHGPYLRYADDVLILCESREAVEKAYANLLRVMSCHGLELHPEKSRYWDLRGNQAYRLDTGAAVDEPLLYLGFELTMDSETRFVPKLGNRSIRRLVEGLREVNAESSRLEGRLKFLASIGRMRSIFAGWACFSSAAEWNLEQTAAILAIQKACLLHQETLTSELPKLAARFHEKDQARRVFYRDVGVAVGMTMDESIKELNPDDVEIYGTDLEVIRRQVQLRLSKANAKPIDLPWGESGKYQHTVGQRGTKYDVDLERLEEEGSLIMNCSEDLPVPIGTVRCRPGKQHKNAYEQFRSPIKISL